MIARWLSQVGSTRSDVFAAYVVVRGYEAGSFQNGPIEAKQFIAIFSRAHIAAPEHTPKLLGFMEID